MNKLEKLITNEYDQNSMIKFIQRMDLSEPKKIIISDIDRNQEQNAKLHAMLTDISNQVEHYGKKWNVLIWKRLCTAAWLREEGENCEMIPAIDGKGFDVIYEKTSHLGIKKCASLINWVQAFGDEHAVKWKQPDYWGGRY